MTTKQTAKRPAVKVHKTSDVPANNPFKDVFAEAASERKKLITAVKLVREKRDALRGVSGTKKEWDEATAEMHSLQARINELNVKLGIPVKTFPSVDKKDRNAQSAEHQRSTKTGKYKGRPTQSGGVRRGEMNILASGSFATPTKSKPEGRADLKNS